jgi:hypothetical protein
VVICVQRAGNVHVLIMIRAAAAHNYKPYATALQRAQVKTRQAVIRHVAPASPSENKTGSRLDAEHSAQRTETVQKQASKQAMH